MQNKKEASFLRELYERKFYNQNSSQGVLQKVISFQRKIQDFKISRTHNIRSQQEVSSFLEDQQKNFRPSTHSSCSRPKRIKYSAEKASFQIDGPAKAELRLILSNKNQAELGLLSQNIKRRNLYSMHEKRKKMKMTSQRPNTRNQNYEEQKSKLTSIDMKNFYDQIPILSSQKRMKPIIYHLKINANEQIVGQIQKRPRSVSRKVVIGGRDLEKAAEEYFKHYKQVNKHIEQHQKQLNQNEPVNFRPSKTSSDKKRLKYISSSRHSSRKSNALKKQKKEQQANKQDLYNQELKPWNVDMDHFP